MSNGEMIILNFLVQQRDPIRDWPPDVLKNRDDLESLIDKGFVKEHFPCGGCGSMWYSIKKSGLDFLATKEQG